MRLDKFLSESNICTRSQAKRFVRQGFVTVNGIPAKSADMKIEEQSDKIAFRGRQLQYNKYVYYMLYKPEGVVSATTDNTARTVVSILGADRSDIFPVGRLDKDTTGLLLLTNDGALAHALISPRRYVDKTYQVTVVRPLTEGEIERLEHGLDIGEERLTLPARVSVKGESEILLTIHEGKFHQVKRMLQAVDNRVLALKRVSFGGLDLDEKLAIGEYRELTPEEIDSLKAICGLEGGNVDNE